MKKKALKKEFRMEIRRSLNRFLSIMFIVALGVMIFAGVHASAPDMRATGDDYFDQTNLMDLRVISTLGLTGQDLEAMEELSCIEAVYGSYMEDVYCQEADSQEVLHIEAMQSGINELTPMEGRLPEKAGECFLDSEYAAAFGYEVGDTLEIQVESEEDTMLLYRSYTISGYGYSPNYISFVRGSTTLGTGSLTGFVYVLPEAFDSEIYSVAYLQVVGAKEQMEFTEGYDTLIEEALEQVEAISDVCCELRYQEVMEEAQSELDEAKQEVADGRAELEDAKRELEEGKAEAESELAEAEAELLDGEEQLEDGKKELEDAKTELADGKNELADGEQELSKNEQTLAAAQSKLDAARLSLQEGEAEYKTGLKEYEASQPEAEAQLEAAQQQLDSGKAELAYGWTEYQENIAQLEAQETLLKEAEAQLGEAQTAYNAGKTQLDAAKAAYEAQLAAYTQGNTALESKEAALTQRQAAYEQSCTELDQKWTAYSDSKAAADKEQAQLAAEEQTVQSLLEAYQAAAASETQLESEIQALQAQSEALSDQLGTLEQQKAELEQKKTDLEQKKALPNTSEEEAEQLTKEIAETAEAIQKKEQEIAEQRAAKDAVDASLSQKKEELTAAEQSCTQKKAEYETAAAAAAEHKRLLQQQTQQLEQTSAQLNEQERVLSAEKLGMDTEQAALTQEKSELAAAASALSAAKQEIDDSDAELSKQGQTLAASWNELQTQQQALAAGKDSLSQLQTQLAASQAELDAAQSEIDAGYTQLEAAEKQLKSARKELDLGWAKLNASQKEVSSGQQQLSDGRSQLAAAREQLRDGLEQLQEAEQEIAENEEKLQEGWDEYEDGKKEAEDQLADGEQQIRDAEKELSEAEEKIQDAEKELADIKLPKWYVNDRNVLQEHTGFGENAERLTNIAQVFPLLFFLVAALISLTTMTRMVEEERTQIGTLKALGYSKIEIAGKYLKYAFWATVGGSLFGILIGEKFLPWVIITAYGIMYVYLPKVIMPYHWDFGLAATAIALLCTIGATLSSCYCALQTVPAQLMRPPAPKVGKKIFLERLSFIWRHLSFSWKSAVRNLMRYKKRCLMTMIGIGGCMGLLLVGYGLRDSIMDIAVLQFSELQTYDAMVVLDTDDSKEQQSFLETTRQDTRISAQKGFYMQSQTIQDTGSATDREWSVYLYVPEDTEALSEFLTFQNRKTKETYELTDKGAIITEKVANKLGIEAGDTITLESEDRENVEIPIAAVCENYLSHYLYLTPTLYEQVYGNAPEYNSLFFKSNESQETLEEIGASILENDCVLNITYTSTMIEQVEDMLVALNSVMIVFIGAAGALAFVVLYNLNNININERRRELATLKVLGFFDGEVGAYIYRENIVLTLAGTLLGCLIGKVLHQFIILTVEVDSCMFGRQIKPASFLIGTLFTIAFSLIVNWVMYFKLKKIDMVESLKSIE